MALPSTSLTRHLTGTRRTMPPLPAYSPARIAPTGSPNANALTRTIGQHSLPSVLQGRCVTPVAAPRPRARDAVPPPPAELPPLEDTAQDKQRLHELAEIEQQRECAEALLSRTAAQILSTRDSAHRTVLHGAVAKGELHFVETLMRHPDAATLAAATDVWNATPLAVAADLGRLDIVEALRAFTPAPNIAPPQPVRVDDSSCWVFTGADMKADLVALNSAAAVGASRGFRLQFAGLDAGGEFAWADFKWQLRQSAVAGAHWLINAHGGTSSPVDTRHTLEFTHAQHVPTCEVIHELIERGVRRIEIWCCRAPEAAAQFISRVKADPHWQWPLETVQVTFHGGTASNSSALDALERERTIQSLADPRKELLNNWNRNVSGFTRVTLHAQGRAVQVQRGKPGLENLRSLPGHMHEATVRDFLSVCCIAGMVDELRDALLRFPQWVDVNHVPPHNGGASLLAIAAHTGHREVVELLLGQPGIRLGSVPGVICPLSHAARGNYASVVDLLLGDPRTTSAHVLEALAEAKRLSRANMVTALENWVPPPPAWP